MTYEERTEDGVYSIKKKSRKPEKTIRRVENPKIPLIGEATRCDELTRCRIKKRYCRSKRISMHSEQF